MKRKFMQKVITCTLISAIALSGLAGCGNNSNQTPNSTPSSPAEDSTLDDSQDEAPSSNPVSDEPVTFTMLWSGEYNEDFKVLQKIAELTNVNLKVEAIPDGDYDTKRDVVLASGNMPNIVAKTRSSSAIDQLGMNGKLLAIDKYFDQLPNLVAKIEEIGCVSVFEDCTAADGHMYQLPMAIPEVLTNTKLTMVRKDVFEDLNIPIPATWDEMYDACVKIKEEYPDSYPMQVVYNMGNLLNSIAPSFGIKAGWDKGRNGFCYDAASDSWFFGPGSDQFKEMLEYLNKCYENGILDKEFSTMDATQYGENCATNRGFVMIADWLGCEVDPEKALQETNPNANWEVIYPLAGPVGRPQTSPTSWWTQACAFSADLEKDPNFPIFLRWLNWMYSEEAIDLLNFGVEGESYTLTAEGKVKWASDIKTSANPDGSVELGAVWGIGAPSFSFIARPDSAKDESEIISEYVDMMEQIAKNGDYTVTDPIMHLSEEELEEESLIGIALNDYVDMMTEKFILGSESFDNWDAFVSECNAKGAKSLTTLYNNSWDSRK